MRASSRSATRSGCNPVIVRRIYGKLKRAGLLDTGPGRRSLELARDARSISLLEIVEAITPLDRAGVFGVEAPLSGT
ncbi:MAG: Rrf2 family transcriptional regulator, partial [Eggerthellaceae bacterium]|nr:Rrf2 family transcriptional regulator [Eggerthellaceae bacterium]